MQEHIYFKGEVVALQPIFQVSPVQEKSDSKDDSLTGILKKRIVFMDTEVDETTKIDKQKLSRQDIPYISSNTFRSLLRTSLATDLLELIEKGKNRPDFYTLYSLFLGGTFMSKAPKKSKKDEKGGEKAPKKTGADSEDKTSSEVSVKLLEAIEDLRQKNVVLRLFGGALGKVGLPGKLSVGLIWPVCYETVKAGLVPPVETNIHGYQLACRTAIIRHNKFSSQNLIQKMSEEGMEDYLTYSESAKTEKENGKGNEAGNIQQLRHHEYIPAGTKFYSEIIIKNPDKEGDIDLGAMLSALERFSKNPVVGGANSRGYGKVAFNYDVFYGNKKVGSCGNLSAGREVPFEVSGDLPECQKIYRDHLDELLKSGKIEVPKSWFV